MRKLIIYTGLLLIGSGLYVVLHQALPTPSPAALPKYPIQKVQIGHENFSLLVTRTQKERELGLGAVRVLPEHHGMLFEFSEGGQVGIWMKGMKYPIDIIWLNPKKQVIHIERNAQPSSYPKNIFTNPAGTSAYYVIEVHAGETTKLGLQKGQSVDFIQNDQ
jgi:uncharacterized membrane protein (UPF0127 family)